MDATVRNLGHLSPAVARLASSPHLLDGFLKVSGLFEATTLDPLAREVLILTVATRNACHICVAMHTAKLTGMDADARLIAALRDSRSLDDERLEAIRVFTLAVLETSGAVDDATLQDFFARGYTAQNALEVVLGIGAYTLSTLANRLVQAPLDDRLKPYAWHPQVA
ncbi:MAG TPA: carboxymuconolactone decarboxylase family protein [Amycolatopsis sp.]|uniref:carboxymuconolactone decarboxylase family protein n=1 Tax=Amycolatopsis sp. TaxID=37632 RepID=UPI002B49A535|nr:carboxymuconolactone decarboxylase family protein [Amycolatopsis sp.]HKS49099.1 carboxymuconolactone decarboxylase family protein [Amycolatopsis sp.]